MRFGKVTDSTWWEVGLIDDEIVFVIEIRPGVSVRMYMPVANARSMAKSILEATAAEKAAKKAAKKAARR